MMSPTVTLGSQYVFQDIIPLPSAPTRIPVRRYLSHEVEKLVQAVQLHGASVLGVSLQLSVDATIDTLALANKDRIYLLDLQAKLPRARRLQELFYCKDCPLVSFDMARVALQLYRVLGCHSIGVDLGTLASPSTRDSWSPQTFIRNRINPDVNRHDFNTIWFGQGEDNLCLRAWLSAL